MKRRPARGSARHRPPRPHPGGHRPARPQLRGHRRALQRPGRGPPPGGPLPTPRGARPRNGWGRPGKGKERNPSSTTGPTITARRTGPAGRSSRMSRPAQPLRAPGLSRRSEPADPGDRGQRRHTDLPRTPRMRDEHPAGPGAGDREAGPAPAGRGAGQVTPAPGPSAPAQPTPAQPTPAQPERRRRWLRIAVAILAVGAMAWLIVANRHTLAESVSSLGQLDFRWFALAVLCEGVSLTAFGLSRRRLLRAEGHQAGFASVMAITYAGNALSMSVPFAGAQLAAVFSYQQFRRRGLDPALTGWALGISAIASSSALAIILIVGAFAGGAPLATAIGFLGAAVFALPGITVILALRYPRARVVANRVIGWALGLVRRIFHRPGVDPAALDEFLEQLAGIRLQRHQYGEVFALAVVNWLADCATLA